MADYWMAVVGNHVWDQLRLWCRYCHLTAEEIESGARVLPCVFGSWLER